MTQKVHTYVATPVAIHTHTYIRIHYLTLYIRTYSHHIQPRTCIHKCICMYVCKYVYTDVHSPYDQIGKQHSSHVQNFDFMCHPAKLGARRNSVTHTQQEPRATKCHIKLRARGYNNLVKPKLSTQQKRLSK